MRLQQDGAKVVAPAAGQRTNTGGIDQQRGWVLREVCRGCLATGAIYAASDSLDE
jgi:hypothetical protein